MAIVTKPHGDFVNNLDVANANYVNDQMNTLYTLVNGNLDYTNVQSASSVHGVTNPWGDNTTSSRPSLSAYMNTDFTVVSAGTFTKLPLSNTLWDNLSEFSAANNRIVAKQAGQYLFTFGAVLKNAAANNRLIVSLYKNGALACQSSNAFNPIAGDNGTGGSYEMQVSVGDYFELYVYCTTANQVVYSNGSCTFLQSVRNA